MINSIITCIISLIFCFYGLKLKKIVLALCFSYITYEFSNFILSPFINNASLLRVLCIGIGLLLGLYSTKLYKLTSFITCFILTFMICKSIINIEILNYIIGIVLGIIMGYLSIKFLKTVIIFLTSISGSINFSDALNNIFPINNISILLIITIVVAILGINYQFKTNKES